MGKSFCTAYVQGNLKLNKTMYTIKNSQKHPFCDEMILEYWI